MFDSINVLNVVTRHLDGFRPPGKDKARKVDVAVHYVVPAFLGLVWAIWGPATEALGNLVQGLAILTGLFFGLFVYVFQLRLDFVEKVNYQRSVHLVSLIDALFRNTVYATLIGGVATVGAVIVDLLGIDSGPLIGVVIALSAHLALTAALIIRRASAAYTQLVKDKRRAQASDGN
ncbi:MAG: hypothetical protein L0G94_17575 [Brachybacterium sp.]|uniref:hypothetical protein n=1 Tax=Brachybacterium sp. TaxID=1891286 RepID=UPI002648E83E|nr:hypothetical protein [Brachybacterium sp.]MDN5688467.1 hypothetical protein [Brachybacterium sp.]